MRDVLKHILAGGMLVCAMQAAQAGSEPIELVVSEGFKNPIGFYDATPTFSWKLPNKAVAQTAYRVVVATDAGQLPGKADLWDSGKVESDQSLWIRYGGKPLQSRQKVFWQVQVWDAKKKANWSAVAHFELGLLENADWAGQWIRMQPPGERPAASTAAALAAAAAKVEIHKAVYGVRGKPEQQVDITAKLRAQVARKQFAVTPSNELAGKDPAHGIVKTLEITYSLNGKKQQRSIPENATVNLLTGKPSGRSPSPGKSFIPEYLRQEFSLADKVASARLYVTAKGLYEVYLNGERVGKDYMVPGWTPYHTRIETLTYDVTDHLARGKNAIGAIVGEGWYAGDMMRKRFKYPEAKPCVLVQLEVTCADGSAVTLVSGEGWKASNGGPIRYSNIYHGETYDQGREMAGWSEVGFNDSDWSGVISEPVADAPLLVPKRHYPVQVTEMLKTAKITEPQPGRFVFDLGQNLVGWPILRIPVEKGKQVTIRVAEMLNKDGTLYTANYRAAKSIMHYTPAQTGTIDWHPTFTFFGYRYVELSGLPEGVEAKVEWVSSGVLHSAFPSSGKFISSHALLNQLQQNIRWGQRGNYLDIPTDCPQRNERLGWTGDAQVFCSTSIFNYDVYSFWMSWLQSVREDQTAAGLVCHVVPDTGCGAGSPGWGDVAVTSPWNVYVRTGDLRVLEENYDMMVKWTAAYERQAKDFIVDRGGFGDWLQPYPKGGGNKADTPMNLIATAYFGECARLMNKAALALGKQEDAKKYGDLHAKIRAAFSKKFFDANGKMTTTHETQTGYLMALAYDLLEPGLRKGAVAHLLKEVEAADGHLRTGFLGTPLIAFVLDREGHQDVAYQVLFKETYPSWFYSIHQGATTMWERWNSYSHDKGFGNAGMNSFNHYAYGAIGEWMYERIAGLAPDPAHPGYKHFFIQPNPGGPLTHAAAELETPYGLAKSGWKLEDGKLTIEAVVPPNTTATLVVPAAYQDRTVKLGRKKVALMERDGRKVLTLEPGEYRFVIE